MTIGWRRLELSTWAKLLDLEKERCDENVSSWWFVAYEALLAVPLQMAESGEQDMSEHIQGVIATLEQFFNSTSLGQFTRRLQLVSDFQALLVAFVNDHACLSPLVSALSNFLSHFRPFEPSVDKILQDKRSALEKDIKEQILLASWKDTNIVALKESARRSHVKLFKLVRKYRAALAQPIQPVLEQGLPESGDSASELRIEEKSLPTALFPEVLSICQSNKKLWSSRALRFQNPDGTARNMMNLYSSIPSEFDIAKDLDDFTVSIIEAINEFKSSTPKTLTEENKDDVQHLKVQKRRLFADTLKRLFEMGIKRNAGTNLIEAQVSLAQVLSTSAAFESSTAAQASVQSADSYFHRLLDLVPRARLATRNYSDELSNVEVSRSMGSIEYLLFIIRRQRGALAPALSDLGALKSTLDKARHLWTIGSDSLIKAGASASEELLGLTRIVAWLSPILGLASTIIEVHSRFSGIPVSSISQVLKSRKAAFDDLRQSLQSHPSLPSGITSTIQKELIQRTWASLAQLETDLKTWVQDRPDLSFAFEQITPWLQTSSVPPAGLLGKGTVSIQNFDDSLLSAVDKMLVGLQQLKDVPNAITFDGLMSRSDEFFSRASRAVHLNEITSSLADVLDKLQHLQDKSSAALPMAAALVASILPIATKYHQICQDLTDRFISVHREICKTSYVLTKTFTQVAAEGFCSPAEASQDEGKEGKMESGTGLGDGEGAEDISKDVGDDEDLSELAQQAQKEDAEKDEMEDSADAVNMDQEELEGETGDHKEEEDDEDGKDDKDDDEEDDIDEEVGSVDDLDSGAIDEKLWDGANDEQQKETENEEGKGQAEDEQQAAAQEQKKDGEEGPKGEEEEGDEDDDEEEAPDDETLDLPDEMLLDGDDQGDGDEGEDDDGMDELDDMGPLPDEEQKAEEQDDQAGDEDVDMAADDQVPGEDEEMGEEGEETNEGEGQEEENEAGGEDAEDPEQDEFLAQRDDDEAAGDDVAPSDAVNGGLAADQDQNEDKGASGDAQQESGSSDPNANAEQQTGAAKESEESKRSRDAGGAEDSAPNEPQMQAFKKLGDILEQWHRRQKEVLNPSQEEEDSQPLPQDTDMADADFEHLKDDDDVADTQALGQANEDQAKALDQNKGVESENRPGENEVLPDISDELQDALDNQLQDEMQIDREAAPTDGQAPGAFIPGDRTSADHADGAPGAEDVNEELDEVDSQLAAIHLSSTLPPLTPESAVSGPTMKMPPTASPSLSPNNSVSSWHPPWPPNSAATSAPASASTSSASFPTLPRSTSATRSGCVAPSPPSATTKSCLQSTTASPCLRVALANLLLKPSPSSRRV
jgi:midasin